jgi:hypothetical protein
MRNNHNNKVAVDEMVRFVDGHLHMVQVLHDLLVQQQQQQHLQPIVPVCVSNLRAPSPTLQRCCTSIEQMIDLNIRTNILAIETSLTIVIIVRTSRCPSLRDGHIINRLRLTSPSLGSGLLPFAATASWRGGNVAPRPQLDSLMRVSVDTEQEAGKVTAERSTVIGGFLHVAKILRKVDSLSLGWVPQSEPIRRGMAARRDIRTSRPNSDPDYPCLQRRIMPQLCMLLIHLRERITLRQNTPKPSRDLLLRSIDA